MFRKLNSVVAMLIAATFAFNSIATAEEIIIEEGNFAGVVSSGDFDCSPCLTKLAAASFLMRGESENQTVEMTAGELWKFFHDQGFNSVNKMTLFLDVDQLSSDERFNLSNLNIQIQSPLGASLLTDTNLGDGIVVPGYETSSSRPEAQLSFDLGYDFMELFSPESTELVRVSIDSPSTGSITPTFHLVADDNVFGRTNVSQLFLFVMFWGIVFLILLRWMKPVRNQATQPMSVTPVASAAAAATARRTA